MHHRKTFVAMGASALLLLAACGSDTTSSSSDSTAASDPTTTSAASSGTSAPAGVTVETEFADTATANQADQAAEVMTKRLEAYGFPGSTATVNSAGTGLTITVVGATSAENAQQILQPLTINGSLYFRPALEGPIAPGSGETPSPQTAEVLDQVSPGSTLPGTQVDTTPPDQDDPAGESVLIEPDKEGNVIARWKVGPAALDATAVTDANPTTHNDLPAVQIVLKSGSPGIDQFNAMAEQCFEKQPTCPTGTYTVVFDSNIITAAQVSPTATSFTPFSTTGVIIWSPDWTTDQTKAVAAIITIGEMPVQLVLA